jgi:aryl-alcohol dehydrogenase-like predicted oxidoreductase
MRRIELDSTGTLISAVGFGGMHLSLAGRPDEATARQVLNAALDAGVTFIDTADVYCMDDSDIGHNERLIASTVAARDDSERIFIATKGGFRRPGGAWTRDGSPQHLREACERSLRALGTSQISLYQLHALDPDVPFEASVKTLAALQSERKVRHIGLSNVSVEQIQQAQSIVDVVSVQNRLSPYFREAVDRGVVEYCADQSITFLAYSPVGGARLARRLPSIEPLQRIAERHGVSVHAVVLAWVRAQGRTVVPIPSATRVESALDSAGTAGLSLAAEELREIDRTHFPTD